MNPHIKKQFKDMKQRLNSFWQGLSANEITPNHFRAFALFMLVLAGVTILFIHDFFYFPDEEFRKVELRNDALIAVGIPAEEKSYERRNILNGDDLQVVIYFPKGIEQAISTIKKNQQEKGWTLQKESPGHWHFIRDAYSLDIEDIGNNQLRFVSK